MYLKKTIKDIDIKDKKVLLRLDLNVPVENGKITDNNRIIQTLPTINYLLENNSQIIILSHFSRIKSIDDVKSGKKSLKVVADEIKTLIPSKNVLFISTTNFDEIKKIIEENKTINIFVLENTRYYDVSDSNELLKWESKNYTKLSEFWANLGDVFINDAFGTSHRSHASNVGIAKNVKSSAIGFLVEKELLNLSKAINSSEKEKVLILGGSKVSDKLKLINEIAPKVSKIIIGGGMSYTFLKSMNKDVGKSIVEDEMIETCKNLLEKYKGKLLLPVDHRACAEFKDSEFETFNDDWSNWNNFMALDIGPKTEKLYCDALSNAKVVIWNGPMGVFEFKHFEEGTKAVAKKLVEITKNGAYTVIGGGDSAAAADKFGFAKSISFISTGGGASLAFFEGSEMPGIEVITNK